VLLEPSISAVEGLINVVGGPCRCCFWPEQLQLGANWCTSGPQLVQLGTRTGTARGRNRYSWGAQLVELGVQTGVTRGSNCYRRRLDLV
jgi:hypothetical protein